MSTHSEIHHAAPDPASRKSGARAVADAAPVPRRRWVRRTLIGGAVAAVVAIGGYLWVSAPASLAVTGAPECAEAPVHTAIGPEQTELAHARICAAMTEISQAWADHDAEAYGEAFTENATYTTFAGTHYQGRTDIAESHQALFDGVLEGTELADRFLALDVLTEDVAVLTTRGDTYEGSEPTELSKVQSYTFVRSGEQWLVASFHNTQRQEAMERIQFLWMPGSAPVGER